MKKNYTRKEVVKLIKEAIYKSYKLGYGDVAYDVDGFCDGFLREKGLLKEEFKAGWYKWGVCKLFLTKKISSVVYLGYGFGIDRKWIEGNGVWWLDGKPTTPMTTEEVSEMLKEEAKKRGFKYGVTFYDFDNSRNETIINDELKHGDTSNRNVLYAITDRLKDGHSLGVLFLNGKWADIVEEKKLSNFPSRKYVLHGDLMIFPVDIDDFWKPNITFKVDGIPMSFKEFEKMQESLEYKIGGTKYFVSNYSYTVGKQVCDLELNTKKNHQKKSEINLNN